MSSVRKKDQTPHRFTTLDLILDMYNHTTNLIANEKIFDPKFRSLIDKMENEAATIYHLCRAANEDFDNRKPEEAEIRIRMQAEAIKRCLWLKSYIFLAQRKFHLRAKKVAYWVSLVNKAMESIKGWHVAENRNYKEKYGL